MLVMITLLNLAAADPQPETEVKAKAKAKAGFDNLAEQLDDLALQHDIDIRGLALLKASPPVHSSAGVIEKQLQVLLSDYNYVAIRGDDGIEQIIVLGFKQHVPDETIINTSKKGQNHFIEAALIGPSGDRVEVTLMIDTGAAYIVLPKTMIAKLGLDEAALSESKLQTANGMVKAEVGELSSLEIGDQVLDKVAAAFVEDDRLGDVKLLGMNVLNMYRFTLDDEQQTMTLLKIK